MAIRGDSVFIGGHFNGADGLASGALRWNIQGLVSARPKRVVAARKGGKTVKYLLVGEAASSGTDLYGMDGRKLRSAGKPVKHPLRAGPVVEVE